MLTEISTVTGANNLIVLGLRFFSAMSSPVGYLDVLRLRELKLYCVLVAGVLWSPFLYSHYVNGVLCKMLLRVAVYCYFFVFV